MDKNQVMTMIMERHSVRSYLDKPIGIEKAKLIKQEVERLNMESGLSIQFMPSADGIYGSLISKAAGWKKVPSYFALVGKDDADLERKCGYFGEQLVLYCQSIGLNTCWAGLVKKGKIKAVVKDGQKMAITIAVGYGAKPGKPHKSKPLSDVTDVPEDKMPDWFKAGMESALLAPTSLNQQKFLISLDDNDPIAKVSAKGPFVNVDLGIVAYHFEAASGHKVSFKAEDD